MDMVGTIDTEPPTPVVPTVLKPPTAPENTTEVESTDLKPKKNRGKKISPKQEDLVCRTVDSQEHYGELFKLRAEEEWKNPR